MKASVRGWVSRSVPRLLAEREVADNEIRFHLGINEGELRKSRYRGDDVKFVASVEHRLEPGSHNGVVIYE
ncbi:MAG: hypothetical protein R2706_02110 [Acidimicrobiales bacterium]